MSMMEGFAVYELRNVETGMFLYSTTASAEEIEQANLNLRQKDLPSRFFPVGDFYIPLIHDKSDQR